MRSAFSEPSLVRQDLAQNHFRTFCHRLQIADDLEVSRVLYLTWLVESEGWTSRHVNRLLTDLDVAAQLEGRQRWRQSPEVAAFLPGLFRRQGLGPTGERADPLYRELVDVLVDAVMASSPAQLRDQIAVLLVHNTPLRQVDLPRLQWRDVVLRRDSVRLSLAVRTRSEHTKDPDQVSAVVLNAQRGPMCVVSLLRRLRECGASPDQQVFAPPSDGPAGRTNQRVQRAVRRLREPGCDVRQLVDTLGEEPLQVRDRAILLMAYGGALGTLEVSELRQKDVTVSPEGLILTMPGRTGLTQIRANPGMPNDPVSAWESWMVIVREQGRQHPGEAAFFRIWGHTVSTRAIGWQGLHELVQRAVRAAELTEGHYAFSSLRWGLIRTAFRADEPIHLVAQQAGLRSLNRIGVHHRREHIIRRSVAGQLGL